MVTDSQRGPVRRAHAELQRLRDTLRLKLHLAGLEMKESWERLETELEKLQRELERLEGRAGEQWRESATTLLEESETSLVRDVMKGPVLTCRRDHTLARAAELLLEGDRGSLPVLDDEGRAVGTITDRDICMAAYRQGKLLSACNVESAMSKEVESCAPEETLRTALHRMQVCRLSLLPVLDGEGRPVASIALDDIAQRVNP